MNGYDLFWSVLLIGLGLSILVRKLWMDAYSLGYARGADDGELDVTIRPLAEQYQAMTVVEFLGNIPDKNAYYLLEYRPEGGKGPSCWDLEQWDKVQDALTYKLRRGWSAKIYGPLLLTLESEVNHAE